MSHFFTNITQTTSLSSFQPFPNSSNIYSDVGTLPSHLSLLSFRAPACSQVLSTVIIYKDVPLELAQNFHILHLFQKLAFFSHTQCQIWTIILLLMCKISFTWGNMISTLYTFFGDLLQHPVISPINYLAFSDNQKTQQSCLHVIDYLPMTKHSVGLF